MIVEFKKGMSARFEMSNLGLLTYYLCIEVLQYDGGIKLVQERYARKILEESCMSECNAVQAPMDSGLKLSIAKDEQPVDEKEYMRQIGCLRYLIHTRPDLSYDVGVLSRYMNEPKVSHAGALKKVLRYLKGTLSHGLTYKNESRRELVGYVDSGHNIDEDDRRSTTGHIFYLNDCLILWCSTKQDTVALSLCEAEFMAATEADKQEIWLQELLEEISKETNKRTTVYIDNKSAIALTKNLFFHGWSKHIYKRYPFIRECIENEQIKVQHVLGNEEKADILTKVLGMIKLKEMRDLIGVNEVKKERFKFKGGKMLEVNLKIAWESS